MFTQKELAEAIAKSGLSRETPEGRVSLQLKRATDTIVSPSSGKTSTDFGIANPSWTQAAVLHENSRRDSHTRYSCGNREGQRRIP